ncbi:ATP-binding protein [Arcanobacterium canis]
MDITKENFVPVLESLRLRQGDSDSIEVKRAQGGLPSDMGRTIAAFANMPAGGTIIFGVDEKTGFTLTGVEDPASLEAALIQHCRSQVNPAPHIETRVFDVEGKKILVFDVRPLPFHERPATYQGIAYLRQSDGEYPMQPWELRMIESEKFNALESRRFDAETVSGTSANDLVLELVERYLRTVRRDSPRLTNRSDEEILHRTGVISENGQLTLAGLYGLGDYPQGAFPALTVTAAVRLGNTDEERARNLTHFEGPIPVLLDELMLWCERSLNRIQRYKPNGKMEDALDLPLSAIRELVANALIHRDLSPNTLDFGKSIQIRLHPNKLMILSPGGLRGVSIEQLMSQSHAQAAVNQTLYQMMRRMTNLDGERIIEGEGGGIQHVFDAARKQGLRKPTLVNSGTEFKALLWRPEPGKPLLAAPYKDAMKEEESRKSPVPRPTSETEPTKNEPLIIDLLRTHGELAAQQIAELSGLTLGQLYYALAHARKGGRIIMEGSQGKRSTIYRLPN